LAIKWTSDLSVGVEHIDAQHKIWFEKADQLFQAGKSGKAKETISQIFDFLEDYTKFHFKDEEEYMEQIKYPDLDKQINAHRNFERKLANLKKEYQESGYNIALIINANKMIVDWLTQHISTMDKQIGVYVKSL